MAVVDVDMTEGQESGEEQTQALYEATQEPLEETTETLAAVDTEATETWKTEKAELERKYSDLEKRFEAISPQLQELDRVRQERLGSAANEIAARVVTLNETSSEPLEEGEIRAVEQLIRNGLEYRIISNNYQVQNLAAESINRAGAFLSQDPSKAAIIRELQELSLSLYNYGDPRLMEQHLGIMKTNRVDQTALQRAEVARRRAQVGVDRLTPAPMQTGNATEFSTLEAKMANRTASPAEEARYARLYGLHRGRHYGALPR